MSQNLRGLSRRKGIGPGLFEEISEASLKDAETRVSELKKTGRGSFTGDAHVLGVSSFYDLLKDDNQNKRVYICDGTACITSGSQEGLLNILKRHFKDNEIGTLTCLGKCHTNHAFMLDGKTWAVEELSEVEEILKSGIQKVQKVNTVSGLEEPVLLKDAGAISDLYGLILKFADNPIDALKEIEVSGLRGRGGAGFPFYIKIRSCLDTNSNRKYIVCNADEGDPGSFSDKYLLEEKTHKVLFGMLVCGYITGADTGILYIRGEYPESVKSVEDAIKQYETLITTMNILPAGFRFNFRVIKGRGAYVCGEETSLLNSIEGLRPEVRTRPPYPTTSGLFGKPTLLSNVETFASVHAILENGGAKYASIGSAGSTGTKLVSLDGAFLNAGVVEAEMGSPMRIVLDKLGGGTRYPVKAFHVGGPLGGIIPSDIIRSLNLDFESFASAGFLLGHAGIVSIPQSFSWMEYLLNLFEFTRKESCGKCFPCRIGSKQGENLISLALKTGMKIDKSLFMDLLDTMQDASLCALGGGLPLPVRNILKYFGDEIKNYFD